MPLHTVSHDLGQRLRACRMDRGWTISELARRSGVSSQTIGDIEHHRNRAPAYDKVVKLARALGIDPDIVWPVEERAMSMTHPSIERYITVPRAAQALGVPRWMLEHAITHGGLPVLRQGRGWPRIRLSAAQAYFQNLEEQQRGGEDDEPSVSLPPVSEPRFS